MTTTATPEQQILLNIYFTKKQQATIKSFTLINENILNSIETYASLNGFDLEGISDYKIIYPIRAALDFIGQIKIKPLDNFSEKINEAFEKNNSFDIKSCENIIFANLLLSENKLLVLVETLKDNLTNYVIEEIRQNNELPNDFYESILLISNVNLNILKKQDHANFEGTHKSDRHFSFRPSVAISNIRKPKQSIGEQDWGNPEKNNPINERSENTDGLGELSSREGRGVETDGENARNNGIGIPQFTDKSASTLSETVTLAKLRESALESKTVQDFLEKLRLSVKAPETEFTKQFLQKTFGFDDRFSSLEKLGKFSTWYKNTVDRNRQDNKPSLKMTDRQEIQTDSVSTFGEVVSLEKLRKSAFESKTVQDFLETVKFFAKEYKTEFTKEFFQKIFELNDDFSSLEKLDKFSAWYKNTINNNNHDGELTLRVSAGEVSGEPQGRTLPASSNREQLGELHKPTGDSIFDESRGSRSERDGGKRSNRLVLGRADTELITITDNQFSLPTSDGNPKQFNATRKLEDNLNALITLNNLLSDNRKATDIEKVILSQYIGFGGLKDIVLNPNTDEVWGQSNQKNREPIRRIQEEIAKIEEFGYEDLMNSVRVGILDAFYTNEEIITGIYQGLATVGFSKGAILEPSAGIGNFIGYMPIAMRTASKITQVEIDPISALISQHLYSDTQVINKPFQAAALKNKKFDLVISNIPFGDTKVYDGTFKGELAQFQNRIHNYFIAKSLLLAKQGAIVALVASKKVLDSPGNQLIREYIEQNGNVLGAIRLPHKAFQEANTQANADIIFIQKTAPKLKAEIIPVISKSVRINTETKEGYPAYYDINEYFVNNPKHVLGEVKLGGMYDQNDHKVLGNLKDFNLSEIIQDALSASKPILKPLSSLVLENEDESKDLDQIFISLKEGAIGVHENVIYKKNNGIINETKINEPIEKVKDYLALKYSLTALISAEYSDINKISLDEIRENTLILHQDFIATHGAYSTSLKNIIKTDEDYYNVLSLSDKNGKNADILHFPTIVPLKTIGIAENIDDAIAISLFETNKIDLELIANSLDKSIEAILEECVGKIFLDPITNLYVHRDEYLSGNVRAKLLSVNIASASGDDQFANHIAELENVIPKDIPANLIEANLGTRWISEEYYNQFIAEILAINHNNVQVNYDKALDSYSVLGTNPNTLTSKTYSTKKFSDTKIFEFAFSLEKPIIQMKVSSNPDEYRIDTEETENIGEKITLIKEKFSAWIWKSAERREVLGKLYNDKFNTTVLRKYDGQKLTFEGLSGIKLHSHQKDATWRLLQNNGGIIDHIVGAGKTLVMITTAMKLKQLSMANKPMIIALKSTVPQILDTFKKAYPLANILCPNENDFKKENRMALFSKIALNDWDCVIITHDNFNLIPQDEKFENRQLKDELSELDAQVISIENNPTLNYKDRKQLINRIMAQIRKTEARVSKLLDRKKDDTLNFQSMGIDHLMVDESQQYKNLSYVSKVRNIAGMSKQEGSKRAFNLLVAVRSLQEKFNDDKGTTFLSGTPISNSLVEMYLIFKYLRPSKMKELDLNTFDQWASNFATPKTDIEFSITGEFKYKTRFSEFMNVPELAILYTEITDIRNDDNLILNKPKMLGNGYQVKSLKLNDIQKEFGERIIEFAKTKDGNLLGIGTLSKGQEQAYMLLATSLANKMSIDMRLIDSSIEYDPNGKVGTLVKTVNEIYHKTNEHKGTQLIFSDTGTPKNKLNFNTLMLDYFTDELSVDAEILKIIFGDYTSDAHKFPSEEKVRKAMSDELFMDEIQITKLHELAKTTEPFNLYQEIKFRLIESGLPENEVAFIHDYKTALQKEKLFDKVNAGEIRVVLGSTQKLGTGVNVQERNVAIHHMDATWRPSDMEQRNGRGLRQGNKITSEYYNNELPIYAYCSELSLDTFKYQLLHTKEHLIKQVKNGSIDPTMRVIREGQGDAEGGLNFAEILSHLSGNTAILDKIKIEGTIIKLEKSKKAFESEVYDSIKSLDRLESSIPQIEANIAKTIKEVEYSKSNIVVVPVNAAAVEGEKVNHKILFESIEVNGKIIETKNRKEFGEELASLILEKTFGIPCHQKVAITKVFGYQIQAHKFEPIFGMKTEVALSIVGKEGDNYSFKDSVLAGLLVNNLEKTLLNFDNILKIQTDLLERNKEKILDFKELSQRTWNKDSELEETKISLKNIIHTLNNNEKPNTKETKEIIAIDLKTEKIMMKPKINNEEKTTTPVQKINRR